MTRKFKKRLTGTIFLAAFAIIIFPRFLDGKKKSHQDDLSDLLLIPKSSYSNSTQGILAAQISKEKEEKLNDNLRKEISSNCSDCLSSKVEGYNLAFPSVLQINQSEPSKSTMLIQTKKKQNTPYLIQLGALKNANSVHQVIRKLRASEYRVYTLPEKPVHGEMTRIMVTSDPSKGDLADLLLELKKISGLSGFLVNHGLN